MATFYREDWNELYADGDDKERVRLVGVELETKIKKRDELKDSKFIFLNKGWYYDNKDELTSEPEDYDDEYYDDEDDYDEDPGHSEFVSEKLKEMGIEVGGVGDDGGGKEFATYPDSMTFYRQGGSERFKKVMDMLKEAGEPDYESGTHININKLPSDTKTTWDNIYWFYMVFGPQLQKIFGRRRHWCQQPMPADKYVFSPSRMDNDITRIIKLPEKRPKAGEFYDSKSIAINNKKNRYEFRGPKASNDIEEVLAWVELVDNIVNLCSNGYIQHVPFSEVLRGKYIRKYVYRIAKECPERALSPAERNATIADTKYVEIKLADKLFGGEEE